MKEILKAKPRGLSGDPPGMEPQGPRARQRQGWAENLAPWLPGRLPWG